MKIIDELYNDLAFASSVNPILHKEQELNSKSTKDKNLFKQAY